MSRYTTGLQNVGSYQVSGRPWAKTVGLAAGEIYAVEFPNITSQLYVYDEIGSTNKEAHITFAEPRMAIDFAGTTESLEASLSNSLSSFSVSVWVNLDGLGSSRERILEITKTTNNKHNIQISNIDLRLIVDGQPEIHPAFTAPTGWNHIVLTSNGNENHIYINGQLEPVSNAHTAAPALGVEIGGRVANWDGGYDEMILWDRALTPEEVLLAYNNGRRFLSQPNPPSSGIVSRWDFENNEHLNYHQQPDTTSLIYDRVSNNNLVLQGSTPINFIKGRKFEEALSNNKFTLFGHQHIDLECKATHIVVEADSGNSGTTYVSICAALTNIPASRMYELTGPGIDE